MRKLALLIISVLCTVGPAQGQPASSAPAKEAAVTANEVLSAAKQLYASEGPKAALPEYEKALNLFRKDGDQKGEAITLGLIGNCYKRFGDYAKAEDYLQRALAL